MAQRNQRPNANAEQAAGGARRDEEGQGQKESESGVPMNCIVRSFRVAKRLFIALSVSLSLALSVAAEDDAAGTKQVLIVVGPSMHPPGTHEVAAGGRLIKYCLEHAENVR